MSDVAPATSYVGRSSWIAVSTSVGERPTRSWLVRWSPLGGLAWFFAYPIGELIGTGGGDTPAEIVQRAEAHQLGIGVIQVVQLLSPLLLGWFVGGLYVRLRAVGADIEGALTLIGGVAFTALLFVADTLVFAPLAELLGKDETVQLTSAQAILVLEDVSWYMQAGAGVAAALMIVASSLGARGAGSLTGWMFWVSLVLGIVALNTIGFVGVFAWLVWIGLASVAMLMKDRA